LVGKEEIGGGKNGLEFLNDEGKDWMEKRIPRRATTPKGKWEKSVKHSGLREIWRNEKGGRANYTEKTQEGKGREGA
jgi:hypothetical protein